MGRGVEDSHCVTPYTWQIVTSTGQRSTTDEKSEIFCLCSERVCVCDGGGGWDKSTKYLHRYRHSKTANFKILTWTVLYRFSGVLGKRLDMYLIKVAGGEVTGTPGFSSSFAPRGRRNPQA